MSKGRTIKQKQYQPGNQGVDWVIVKAVKYWPHKDCDIKNIVALKNGKQNQNQRNRIKHIITIVDQDIDVVGAKDNRNNCQVPTYHLK